MRARRYLERRVGALRHVDELRPPPRGWIRAIREAIGMNATQLSRRLKVSQPRIVALERAEVDGVVSLASLRRVAEALDCTLVYALVPNQPLEAMMRERAQEVAGERIRRVDHTMRLEDQGVDADDLADERDRLVQQLMDHPRPLWDKA